jgi:actin-related protein
LNESGEESKVKENDFVDVEKEDNDLNEENDTSSRAVSPVSTQKTNRVSPGLTLPEIIANSILQCTSEEKRKKLAARIVLTGGGTLTPGLSQYLDSRYDCCPCIESLL